MICRLLNDGKGCNKFDPIDGCSVYNRRGMAFRARRWEALKEECPATRDRMLVIKAVNGKTRLGQQKQKKR